MRIVSKINVALAIVVGVSAALNFAALQATVVPRFVSLEDEAARRNQARILEAIDMQKDQVAASARDYAFWDDSFAYMHRQNEAYEAKNLTAEPMRALNVNFYVALENDGRVKIDRGFDHSGAEPRQIRLFDQGAFAEAHPLRAAFAEPASRTGLVATPDGIAAVGYAPILDSERNGPQAGVLLFGKLLDLDLLRSTTKVDFELKPVEGEAADGVMTRLDDVIQIRSTLRDLEGRPIGDVISRTSRLVSAAGERAVWAALGLLVLAGIALILTLAFVLRAIALKRITAMQQHLLRIKTTGTLETLLEDGRRDELSEMVAAFNDMAGELESLRERLRRQDYRHGAADQAADILHNIRNAVSPIGAIVADLGAQTAAPWKTNVGKALQELDAADLQPERRGKLAQFVTLSASRYVEEDARRAEDVRALQGIVRHVDNILRDEEAVSQGERAVEAIDLGRQFRAVAKVVSRRPGISVDVDIDPTVRALGHRMPLEQIWGNLLINAAEAIEATGRGKGAITVRAAQTTSAGAPALEVTVADDGDGVAPELMARIFERGFSTRRERSGGLGLHWSANAVAAMGGRLSMESPGAGLGATVRIVLPMAPADLRSAA